ncbi:MAG: hypothetical protein JW876_10830 [Candidatus Krumholzibacteriota bacterium]|nr:hypothetical protein [Candidatus Krumholzibacteriota bacterium]
MIKAKIVRRSPSTWGLVGIFVVLVSTYLFMIILDTDLSDGRFSGRGILVLAGSLLAAFLVQFRFLRAERTFYLGDLLLPFISREYTHRNFGSVDHSPPSDPEGLRLEDGAEYWNGGDDDAAYRVFTEAMKAGPNDYDRSCLDCLLGQLEMKRGNLEAAITRFLACLENPRRADDYAWQAAMRLYYIYRAAGYLSSAASLRKLADHINAKRLDSPLSLTGNVQQEYEKIVAEFAGGQDENLPDRSFSEFSRKAVLGRQSITLRLGDVHALVLVLEEALVANRGLERTEAFRRARDGISIACPNCGEYNDQAKGIVLLSGEGGALSQAKQVAYGGPNAAALGEGRCPGCGGETVTATFDPVAAGV